MEEGPSKKARTNSFIATRTQSYFITIAPGLELIGEEEIKELLNPSLIKCVEKSGKIFFASDRPIQQICQIRSAECIYAFVAELNNIPGDSSGLDYLQNLPSKIEWEPALHLWRSSPLVQQHHENLKKSSAVNNEDQMDASATPDGSSLPLKVSTSNFPDPNAPLIQPMDVSHQSTSVMEPVFRVTGRRTGEHDYRSPQFAGSIGAGLIKVYSWKVDLKQYNMEVYADLNQSNLVLGINLTPIPLHSREHSSNPLTPAIAYCLARLARIKPGQIIVDPMVGNGTILLEANKAWPHAHYIGGDMTKEAVETTIKNMSQLKRNFDVLHWNISRLPICSRSIDITICDIPFGKSNRAGIFKNNSKLFPNLVRELQRVTKPRGKAVILTIEKDLMKKILLNNLFWEKAAVYSVEYGGMDVVLYILHRTNFVT